LGTHVVERIPNPLRSDPPRRRFHDLHFQLRDLIRRPKPTAGACHLTDRVGGADEDEGFRRMGGGGCGGEVQAWGIGGKTSPVAAVSLTNLLATRTRHGLSLALPPSRLCHGRMSPPPVLPGYKRESLGHLPGLHAFHSVRRRYCHH
jgi:hypothetical protein